MPQAHLRFTSEDDEILDSVILFCRGQGKVFLAVKELSKDAKKHIHLLIETTKTISTCGQSISKAFPAHVGNGSKSFTAFKKSLDDNILYCCKGTKELPPVVLFTTLESIVIENAHKKYWEEQQKFVTDNAVNPNAVKKIKVPSFVERVSKSLEVALAKRYVQLQAANWTGNLDPLTRSMYNESRKEIAQHCILNLGQAYKVLDDSIVRKLINGVMLSIVTIYGNKVEREAYQNRVWARTENDVY